jgi:hypothetical protein
MKQILISAVVAAVVTLATLQLGQHIEGLSGGAGQAAVSAPAPASNAGAAPALPADAPPALRYTEALVEDGWVNGTRTAGADNKPLEHADNSICFLTKVELRGIQGPEDANSCRIEIDDFTGFWEVIAEVAEGGQSEVRCNARCLIWE